MLSLNIRKISCKIISRSLFNAAAQSKRTTDPIQEALLEEKCFLVDEKDHIVGHASKRDCHLVQKNGHIPLHRAFSVFLFNKKGDLLLHKRSGQKVLCL